MKRSEVNRALAEAKELLTQHAWHLPDWAHWSPEEFDAAPDLAAFLREHQMGWDVTDFGSGDFANRGLTLFCLRNGVQSDPESRPYAEKLLIVGEEQETPFHCHHVKLEDIINRGGGTLMIEFRQPQEQNDRKVTVRVDGRPVTLEEDEPLALEPGQSVTMPRNLYHRFYAKAGGGTVLGGEVSQVNDDQSDNYFWEPLGRFSAIEEDEPAMHPLWNEVGT